MENINSALKPIVFAFSKISEGIAFCKIVTDANGNPVDWIYLYVNDAYEQINGVKTESVVGKKATEVLPNIKRDPGNWISIYGEVALTGKSIITERYADVRKKWYHVSAYSPEKGYFVSIFEDISERKKFEDNLKKTKDDWERTFDAVPDFIAILDKDYNILRTNKAMAQQLGVTPETAVGLKCYECVHGTSAPPDSCPHAQLLQDGNQHTAEVHEPKLGGDFIVSDTPLRDQKGQLVGSIHVARNITTRKQAEEKLKDSEEKFRGLFTNMIDGFAHCQMVYDANGKPIDWVYLDINNAFERLTGLKKERVLGKKVSEAIPGTLEANPDLVEIYGKVALTGKDERFEIYFKPLKKWFSVSVYSERKGYFIAVFEDVTKRKHIEQALQESERRWSTTLSSIGDAVIATDTLGKILFLNPVAEQLTGWTLAEAKHKPIKEVFHIVNEQTRKEVENPITKVLKLGLIVGLANHTVLIRKDGSEVPIDDSGAPIIGEEGEISGVVLVFRDITERKKAEQAIVDSEERLKRSQEIAHLGSWELDLKEDKLVWSDEVYRIFGLKPQQFGATYEDFLSYVHPEDRTAVDAAYAGSVREGKEGYEIEHRIVRKDSGEIRFVHEKCTHYRDKSGKVIKSVGMVHDITERKKAEKEIARLASFPTLNPAPVLEVARNGKVTYANPATKVLFPTLEANGLNHIFFSDWALVKKAFCGKDVNTFSREIKINNHWYHQQFYLVPNTQQIRIYATDIDELKQTEEARAKVQTKLEENAIMLEEYASQMEALAEQRAQQLQNAERLAAIGQTAGMVGHDIRNPLQAITGDMYLIDEEVADMPEGDCKAAICESIESVNRNILYINKIVSDLQDYTRPLKPNFQAANLSDIVEGTLSTIAIPKGIHVTAEIEENAKPFKTDPAFIRRLLTNLVTNAIQAMQEQGKLTINASRPVSSIVLTIEDSGAGIPDEVKAKMFTPLFTTKSKGQGLGLAVVKRLVEALGGSIAFESDEGKGTKFIVELPQKP